MKEMSFKLSQPIQISRGGEFEEVYELILTAPTMKDRKQVSKLTQFISRAQAQQENQFISLMGIDKLQSMADEAKANGKTEIDVDGDEVKSTIKALITASDEDLEDFFSCFETLMLRVCTVLDDTPIKQPHLEQIDLKDFENICFEYCENFIR